MQDVIEKIINEMKKYEKRRITPMIERKLSEIQLGFRKGRERRYGIFQVRLFDRNEYETLHGIH